MAAKRLLIGVPSQREDERFLASLLRLVKELKGKYEVSVLIEKWKFLPDAQNRIADFFLKNDFDYLLFLDDDHWGHTVEMVDVLVGANHPMATMKTYVRHFPYPCALFRYNHNGDYATRYSGVENGEGYEEVDLCGFPMTLFTKDIFSVLSTPYFIAKDGSGRNWATDFYFCERLEEKGIKPMGCFQHCLPHGDITQENVQEKRENNMVSYEDRLLAHLFLKNPRPIPSLRAES